jgi:hypothetical protein
MATLGRRDPRYGDIRRIRRLSGDYYALGGNRNIVIKTGLVDSLLVEDGEWTTPSPNLDASLNGDFLYVLHEDGLTRFDVTDAEDDITETFDVGGNWVVATDDVILVPDTHGIRVYTEEDLSEYDLVRTPLMDEATDAVFDADENLLYVADGRRARIHVFRLNDTVLSYIDTFRAPNCRDIVKVERDDVNDLLFVTCRNRIVSFDVPNDSVEDDDVSVTKNTDYGTKSFEYVDFLVLADDLYWLSTSADPQVAVFEPDVGAGRLVVAYPRMSKFASATSIPASTVEDIGDFDPEEPPEMIAFSGLYDGTALFEGVETFSGP